MRRFGDASGCGIFALSVRTIVYFDLQVWIARLEEGEKNAWHFLQQSWCLCWMLCSRWAVNPNVDVRAGAQWKLLFARQKKKKSLFIACALQMLLLVSQLLHDLNRNGDEATRESWEKRGRGGKKAGREFASSGQHTWTSREEIFYKGLLSSFCSLSGGLQTFRVACCSLLGAAGEELFSVWTRSPNWIFNPFSGFLLKHWRLSCRCCSVRWKCARKVHIYHGFTA